MIHSSLLAAGRALGVLLVLVAARGALGVTQGQLDGFDADTEGWARGSFEPGSGDGFLRVTTTPNLVTFNQAQWAGDYPAAEVEGIRIDLENEGPADLTLYFAFGTNGAPGPGDASGEWLSTAAPVTLEAGSGWQTFDVPITSFDLVSVVGGGSFGSVMPNAVTLRILHAGQPAASGDPVDAILRIDNIEALPEAGPAAGWLGALLVVALGRRRSPVPLLRETGATKARRVPSTRRAAPEPRLPPQ